MTSFNFDTQTGWRVGQTISVYRASGGIGYGSAVATGTVGANGATAISGLSDDEHYVATNGSAVVAFATLTDRATASSGLTAGQQAALAGTDGAPGAGNRFVTDSDSRLAGAGGGGVARTVSAVAYAATITPALPASGDAVYNVGTLTGNVTVAAPTGTPADGQLIKFRFVQDGTGGRSFTFNAAFAFGSDVQLAMFPTAAGAKFEAAFEYSSADSKWRCVGVVRGF